MVRSSEHAAASGPDVNTDSDFVFFLAKHAYVCKAFFFFAFFLSIAPVLKQSILSASHSAKESFQIYFRA